MDTETDLLKRLTFIEDRLAIYNLLASQPPLVECGERDLLVSIFAPDGVLDRGDLGITPVAEMRENYEKIGMADALKSGLAHLTGLPYVVVDGECALAISYILTMMPDPSSESLTLSGHGTSRGHRILRVLANRWDLTKLHGIWKVKRRTLRLHDGSGLATGLLQETIREMRPLDPGL